MTAPLAEGTTFAGLRVEAIIGRGGMGVVYHAVDPSLDRPVALKLIAPELAEDEHFRARFLREPRLAASLDHPHVVPVYDAGEIDGQLYLAMRLVEGGDLKALFARGTEPDRLLLILTQIAGALDAAHRRELVHRDVKPANVLLDADEQAYLTDFGISTTLTGDSTGGGQLAGTLSYLAPEQIRGATVDGRTDQYALACVLYEGLTGEPPFRRRTEAETLWGHMHEAPAPVDPPALDVVLRRGLAKGRAERYPDCASLIDAARAALRSAPAAPDGPPRGRRARRRLAIAGAAAVVAAGAAAVLALATGGGGGTHRTEASGVAVLDVATGRIGSVTETATPPSNVAVGEGAVWALGTASTAVARIDPATRRIVRRFGIGGVPSDIAAGAGAVWVGLGGGDAYNGTVAIVRVDPASGRVTHTTRLPGEGDHWPSEGFPGIAVGGGSVWAIDRDASISRIDPRSGRIVARVRAHASTIAAGDAGVWFAGEDNRVRRIDLRTNRIAQTIAVGSNVLRGIAVGGGAVWAAGEHEGVVWRVDPGSHPVTRTIATGPGVDYLAFAGGALWAANDVDGRVSRIDPRRNTVTASTRVGATQALAAGLGSVWVSVAGAAEDGALPRSACAAVRSGGRPPDLLIASDLPLQGPASAGQRQMQSAIGAVLQQHDFRAGRFTVGYGSCDASTAQSGTVEMRACAANANAYAATERLVAVIGPYNSQCAAVELPILARAPTGPLAVISPSNTAPGLTRPVSMSAAWGGYRGEPGVFYPTGVRHYVRLAPGDDLAGTADAVLARQLGLRSAYLLDDGGGAMDVLLTHPFRRAARRLGIRIAGAERYDPSARSYAAVADRIARSRARSVVLGGDVLQGGDRLLRALRARLGRDMPILTGTFGFTGIPDDLRRAGRAALGLYVASTERPATFAGLGPAARALARDLGTRSPAPFVLEAGQATEIVLAAIARSDGTRASVLTQLRRTRVHDGILGTFHFDRNGDVTPTRVQILRVTGSTPPGAGLDQTAQGAVLDRIVEVTPDLLG